MNRTRGTVWNVDRPVRRPVSRLRWAAGLMTLVLLGGTTVLYFRVTDEERLRQYAEQWLRDFSGGEVHIERVHLEPFRGLELIGVTVAAPESARFDPHDNSLAGRTIFKSRGLFLKLHPFSLISGNLVVPEIVAVDPEITLLHRLTDDARNWQVLLKQRPEDSLAGSIRLPVIRLRNLRVAHHRLDEHGRSAGAVQSFWADAQPARDRNPIYDLRIVRVFDDASTGGPSREEGRLHINMRTFAVSGSIPSMNVDDLATTVPAAILRQLEVLGLRGYVRAEAVRFDPQSGGEATLILRDASLTVPINDEEKPLPASERYIQFSKLGGKVHVTYGRAMLDITGLFRDSPVTLQGVVTFGGEGFTVEDLGFDVQVTATGVALPTDDENAPAAERRFVRRWFHLHEFVKDYDARGRVDLALRFQKTPGKDKGIRFVDGSLKPRGASARYFRFPYRLYNLSGEVYFRPDGRIELRELNGTHGRGRAIINGLVDGYTSQGLHVKVRAESIEVDEDLVRCLDEDDQELIRLFNTQARMNLDLQLHRDPKPHGLSIEENPWRAVVDVEFLDGSVKFEGFPYPLSGLAGRMKIRGGGFELDRVRAGNGAARVEVSGRVERGEEGLADMELQLAARDVPLDDTLRAALPPDARTLYERISPRGRMDIAGTVRTSPEPGASFESPASDGRNENGRHGGRPLHEAPGPGVKNGTEIGNDTSVESGAAGIVYDLTATLERGELGLPDTHAHLTDVSAKIRIRPSELRIESLNGRFGPSPVTLTGRMKTDPADSGLSLRLTSDRLVLDEHLRTALPEVVEPIWRMVQPGGAARVDVTYEQGSPPARADADGVTSRPAAQPVVHPPAQPTTQPATRPATQPAGLEPRYTAIIEPLDCTARLEQFPLPLEHVNGRFVLTPERVTLENVSAAHGDIRFELGGVLNMHPDQLTGEMALTVRGIQFTEELRKALPWRMRRLWYDVRPAGRADLFVRRLAFVSDAQGDRWTAEGYAELDHMKLNAGTELTEMTGRVSGRGGMAGGVFVDVDLDLSTVRVDGRLVTDARARMLRPAGDARLGIVGFQGGFYGGSVLGEMEINYNPGRPTFGLSLAARGMSLEDFLNAKRRPDEPMVEARGSVEGTLGLAGRFGDPGSLHGGGTVFIRHAQMARIPMVLSIFKIVHGVEDDNAFDDARFAYAVDGEDLLLQEIDLRGKALSMVGAGRVHLPTERMDLTLLVGSPLRLPRMEVLSELVEGVAREIMEVRVEGTLEQPEFRAEMVKSVRKALEAVFNARRPAQR